MTNTAKHLPVTTTAERNTATHDLPPLSQGLFDELFCLDAGRSARATAKVQVESRVAVPGTPLNGDHQ